MPCCISSTSPVTTDFHRLLPAHRAMGVPVEVQRYADSGPAQSGRSRNYCVGYDPEDGFGLVAGLHGHSARGVRKIVLLSQPAVVATGHLCRRRPFYAPRIPAQQNRQRDFRMLFVGECEEPADLRWRSVIVASAGLPEWHFIPAAVETRFPGAIQNRRQQAFPDFRKDQRNVEVQNFTPRVKFWTSSSLCGYWR